MREAVWLADAMPPCVHGPDPRSGRQVPGGGRAERRPHHLRPRAWCRCSSARSKRHDGGRSDRRPTSRSPHPQLARSRSTPTSSSGCRRAAPSPCSSSATAASFPAGDFEVRCRMRNVPLAHGRYSLWPAMSGHAGGKGQATAPLEPGDVVRRDGTGPGGRPRRRHGALARLRGRRLPGELSPGPRAVPVQRFRDLWPVLRPRFPN